MQKSAKIVAYEYSCKNQKFFYSALFKAKLKDTESEQQDVILCTEIQWLGKRIMFKRFCVLLSGIKNFLES